MDRDFLKKQRWILTSGCGAMASFPEVETSRCGRWSSGIKSWYSKVGIRVNGNGSISNGNREWVTGDGLSLTGNKPLSEGKCKVVIGNV